MSVFLYKKKTTFSSPSATAKIAAQTSSSNLKITKFYFEQKCFDIFFISFSAFFGL